ncbi:hypothetical protein EI546_06405 [Aequorivita sp. H23M31]|uniref:AAA+ ATPase domain-containing protein n=1 Tax=Aequorivita ciconiae TaxID=2494375 RepID=A0A410G2B6_9FLAO|nr:hypothetical protein [Aequorivita sp. H23M31]QAA81381.1 hypothetical protein EI546_06405 [Aequorivita sp. H23M31]
MAKRKKAVSVYELEQTSFKTLPLEGAFKKLIGTPEVSGSWFVFGDPGQGKTTFNMQLAKQITQWERVEYNTLEEGARLSMQQAVLENNMAQCRKGSFKILDKMPIDELKERLRNPRTARVVFIDSVQYTFMTKREYKELQAEFPKHLFIWVSHAKGKKPLGALAEAIWYDSDVKIFVQGFRAYSISRASRGILTEPYTIWEEGARKFHEIL